MFRQKRRAAAAKVRELSSQIMAVRDGIKESFPLHWPTLFSDLAQRVKAIHSAEAATARRLLAAST